MSALIAYERSAATPLVARPRLHHVRSAALEGAGRGSRGSRRGVRGGLAAGRRGVTAAEASDALLRSHPHPAAAGQAAFAERTARGAGPPPPSQRRPAGSSAHDPLDAVRLGEVRRLPAVAGPGG